MTHPERIGPYRISGALGSGGMAIVYRAVDEATGAAVALKVLHAHAAASPQVTASFTAEVELGRRLRHPGLVAVLASGEHEGQPWAAMDLVEGASLEERLRPGPLPWSEAIGVLRHLAEALAYLHAQGIVHRDLKPANIILPPAGGARLLDLGIATGYEAGKTMFGAQGAGTPRYTSPEQVLGLKTLPASHVYSFGLCLFEAIAGHGPYDNVGESEAAVLAAHVHAQPRGFRSCCRYPRRSTRSWCHVLRRTRATVTPRPTTCCATSSR